MDGFLKLVDDEKKANQFQEYDIPIEEENRESKQKRSGEINFEFAPDTDYKTWFLTNVFEQKQPGYYAIKVRIPLGNIAADEARKLADIGSVLCS